MSERPDPGGLPRQQPSGGRLGVEVGYVEIQRAGLRESALELRERVLRHLGN